MRRAACSYGRRHRRPAETPRANPHHGIVKSGITTVSCAACILAALLHDAPRPEVPRGFTVSLVASGIEGARDLDVRGDGTLTLRSGADRYEIRPSTASEPVTILRVAAELDVPRNTDAASLAVQSPTFVRMRWDAASGELGYAVTPAEGTGLTVSPQTLSLARRLARRHDSDVALAPDGSLFMTDSRAGAVWHIRRSTL